MRDAQQALEAWKQYAQLSDVAALKHALWEENSTPLYVNDLRSVCWKALLLFQDHHDQQLDASCLPILHNSRAAYTSLRAHFLKAIENPAYIDETGTDPLSEDEQSLWNSLRTDELVREEIWRDVERCMPDNEYFRDPRIQKYLLDILFIWCKLNPDVGYRQGMHEILAPLVWAVDGDAVDTSTAALTDEQQGSLVCDLLDVRYVEHDAFSLFARVMQTAKSFYEPAHKKTDDGEAPMIVRAKYIFNELLPLVDPELARHLHHIDVLPQIFLMRWVRLLFGREFAFQDVLQMWDLIFAEGSELEVVNYVCIVMLLRIRWQLLQSDMNSALTLLLRYPALEKSLAARDLVLDARSLMMSTDIETGATLIKKYSGRPPAAIDTINRSSTPVFGTPPRLRGPLAMASSPASLESLLQDAAKGVMSTSERWGLNQAVRDVVGEVKRGVERNLPIADPSGWSRSSSPRGFHNRNRSTKASTDTHSAIAANAFRKLNALEQRNRRLAQTLQQTVQDLWAFHEELVNRGKTDGKISKEDGQFAEKLSRSVAEVQFVQAFLQDITLPLPELPTQSYEEDRTQVPKDGSPQPQSTGRQRTTQVSASVEKPEGTASNPHSPAHPANVSPARPAINLNSPSRTQSPSNAVSDTLESQLPSSKIEQNAVVKSQTSISTSPTPAQISTVAADAKAASPARKPPPAATLMDPFLARPRLTSSSFSWMLADNKTDDGTTNRQDQPQHPQHQHQQQPFSRATPFAPNEKRSHARTGKGFLFGEDDDDDAGGGGGAGGNERRGSGRGLGESSGRRKGSKTPARRGGKGGKGAVPELEDIGLGDYGTPDKG